VAGRRGVAVAGRLTNHLMTLPAGVAYYFKHIRYKCRNPEGSFNMQIKKFKPLLYKPQVAHLRGKIYFPM